MALGLLEPLPEPDLSASAGPMTRHRFGRCRHAWGMGAMSFAVCVHQFSRSYTAGSKGYAKREEIFAHHTKAIEQRNCADQGWLSGVNQYADWTEAVLQQLRGCMRNPLSRCSNSSHPAQSPTIEMFRKDLPDEVSWGNLSAIQEPQTRGPATGVQG